MVSAENRCRVVHVGPSVGARGGIATVLRTLADSQLADWYQQSFVATWGRPGQGRLRSYRAGRAELARTLRDDSEPTLVHLHTASRGSFVRKSALLRMAARGGAKTVLHVHGGRFDVYAHSGGHRRSRRIQAAFRRADAVVVTSEEWKERLEQLIPGIEITVIPNPVTLRVSVRTSTASRRGGASGPSLVVFLGKLGSDKGVPELLEAIRRLQLEGCASRFVLAGNGEIHATLRMVRGLPSPELVEVPGWLGDGEVRELLARAEIFVLPSHHEGLPVSLLEAMAAGLCCIVSRVGGIPDVIEGGSNGLLVEPRDVDGLADALRVALEDAQLRADLGRSAQETVAQRFDVSTVARKLSDLYATLGCPPLREEVHD